MTDTEVYKAAIDKFGERYQTDKAIEEMGELIQALIKYRQHGNNKYNVDEEMADVEITLEELKIIHKNKKAVARWKKKKIDRLHAILEDQEGLK